MNTAKKTEVIWTGDNRHTSEKLPVSCQLEWATCAFNLLEIIVSVNPYDLPELNFLKLLDKSKKTMNTWKEDL